MGRRRNIKDADIKIKDYKYLYDIEKYKNDFKAYFNNSNPIHIEIGMGKGNFIMQMALNNPLINFVGIEKYTSVMLQALKKIEELNITNLVLLNYDASNLSDLFSEGQISRIYLNFSDPWPKKAHAKRRLTHSNFLKIYDKILTKDGSIWFKTDNRGLFEFSIAEIANYGFKLQNVNLDLHNSVLDFVNYETEYEAKFSVNGPIYRLEALKYETNNNN